MVGVVPIVSDPAAFTRQVGADAPRPEHVRDIVGVFALLRHGTPPAILASYRAHVLGVAIPAAFPDVDLAAPSLERGVGLRFDHLSIHSYNGGRMRASQPGQQSHDEDCGPHEHNRHTHNECVDAFVLHFSPPPLARIPSRAPFPGAEKVLRPS